MVDLTAIMATVSTAVGIAKELRSIDRGVDEAEYKLKIAILTEAIVDMKMAIVELKEEVAEKDRKIEGLTQFNADRECLVQHNGYSYTDGGDGKPAGLPFCSVCMLEGNLVLTTSSRVGRGCDCPRCKAHFHASSFPWPEA